MSDQHPIEGLMTTAMESLKDMVDVNTIIGDPIESPDGSVIITVSKVGFGFAAGGSEFQGGQGQSDSQDSQLPFGGGSGGGVSITPIAFLVVNDKDVQMIHLNENTHLYEKMLDLAPQAIEKIQEILKNSKNDEKKNSKKEKNESKKKSSSKKKEEPEDEDAQEDDEE